MIHKYFSHTYLVNLERRPDRLKKAKTNCSDIGLIFELFLACDGRKENLQIKTAKEVGQLECYWNLGAAGLVVSVIRIIEDAKSKNYDSILILEDDVEFNININNIITDNWINNIPNNWEGIWFGANHLVEPTKLFDNIGKCNGAYTTHAYALNSNAYDLLLEEMYKMSNPVDVIFANVLHTRGNTYCSMPNVVYQYADYSDITKQYVNYSSLLRK